MSNENNKVNSRIIGSKVQIGGEYVLPIEQSRITQQQAKVQAIIAQTEQRKKDLMAAAEKQTQDIIERAETRAAHIIEEGRQKAEEEYEAIKQEGYDAGFEEGKRAGLAKFEEEAMEALKALEVLASSSFEMKHDIIKSAEKDIVELINAIALKVVGKPLDDNLLYKITAEIVMQLPDKENVTLIVNPKIVGRVSSFSERFKYEIPNVKSVRIVEDPALSDDGTIVETISTRVDARISTKIGEIVQKLRAEAMKNDI